VNASVGAWTYLGDREIENLCRIIATTTFPSIMAKFCPMHALGPLEKGRNALGYFEALITPFSNL
jgi:hypothetical protein